MILTLIMQSYNCPETRKQPLWSSYTPENVKIEQYEIRRLHLNITEPEQQWNPSTSKSQNDRMIACKIEMYPFELEW